MKKIAFFFLFVSQVAQAQNKGIIQIDTLFSSALLNTATKENNKRPVAIYLPPGYSSSSKRYPVLYLLHGIGDDHTAFINDTTRNNNISDLMDAGIASHRFGEMIVVTPDEKTNWFGSFYSNSASTGNWEDFTANELVSYIDSKFRTIANPASRAIAGHSMGGFGAISLSMKHPDVFSVVYAMNGAFICFGGEINPGNPDIKKFIQAKSYEELLATQSAVAIGMLTVAQAFSPDASMPPFFSEKPFKIQAGKVVPNPGAYSKWLLNDVVQMAVKYKPNLLKLKAIKFDSGNEDEYKFIILNNRLFSKKLTALKIPHQFEEYNGDHRNRMWGLAGRIYNDMLPFVFDNIMK